MSGYPLDGTCREEHQPGRMCILRQGHTLLMVPNVALAVYEDLRGFAGMSPAIQPEFMHHATLDDEMPEFRFQGLLGFGGKFRTDVGEYPNWRVDCYPEDRTHAREQIIAATNEQLQITFNYMKEKHRGL